jgi:predicted NAD/FAD-dependent oxidoreductase
MAQHKTASQENTPYIWNDALKVGCCGDWLGSGGTFGALNSALALHQKMLK